MQRRKIIQSALTTNDHLTISNTTIMPVDQLISALGQIDNISYVEASINMLHACVVSVDLVQVNDLQQLGIKGVFVSGNKIRMVIGDDALIIAKSIQQKIEESKPVLES